MAFAWPDGVQNKTKRLISQILWTLHLDFEGAIRDSRDAPMDLMKAMEGHGVEIKNPMTFRMMLPHLDGGKYGKLITRVVIQRRTPEIRLAVRALPEDSFLPDGAGGIAVDDRIDIQLFGDTAWPARGTTRDEGAHAPAGGTTPDVPSSAPARGDARDMEEPARGDARDPEGRAEPAREETRDETSSDSRNETIDEFGVAIRRLDGELEELLAPLPVDDESLGPHEMLDLVVGLVAELDDLMRHGAQLSSGHSEKEWAALLEEKYGLVEQLGRYMRRIKDAEARLTERNKEIEGAQLQLTTLNAKYERLEANNRALLAGERPAGQHLRAAERFISETPSDRPERGRSRPTRPNGRTTGSHSELAYTAGG